MLDSKLEKAIKLLDEAEELITQHIDEADYRGDIWKVEEALYTLSEIINDLKEKEILFDLSNYTIDFYNEQIFEC